MIQQEAIEVFTAMVNSGRSFQHALQAVFLSGATIPQAARVSGHRTWSSLQRYTHLRQAGDKYAGWEWLARVGIE